jgi:hypothetical protein
MELVMFYEFSNDILSKLQEASVRNRIEQEYLKSNVKMFDEDLYESWGEDDYDEYELVD